jgi:hypothetical protein
MKQERVDGGQTNVFVAPPLKIWSIDMCLYIKVIHNRNSMIESIVVELLKLSRLCNGNFGWAEIGLFWVKIVYVVLVIQLVIESS